MKDVKKEPDRIGYEIKPSDIVLIMTGADKAWGTTHGAGIVPWQSSRSEMA